MLNRQTLMEHDGNGAYGDTGGFLTSWRVPICFAYFWVHIYLEAWK